MDDVGNKDDALSVFRKEFESLKYFEQLASRDDLTKEQLQKEFQSLLSQFTSLLKNAVKITKIGDLSQRKLLTAKEKIEDLNKQLTESESNVKELNTILMFYIKATEK